METYTVRYYVRDRVTQQRLGPIDRSVVIDVDDDLSKKVYQLLDHISGTRRHEEIICVGIKLEEQSDYQEILGYPSIDDVMNED